MSDFDFNLQLFAEEAPTSTPTSTPAPVSTPAPTSTPAPVSEPAPAPATPASPSYGIHVDPRTGRRSVVKIGETKAEEPASAGTASTGTTGTEPAKTEPAKTEPAAEPEDEIQNILAAAGVQKPQEQQQTPQVQTQTQPTPQYYTPAEMSLAMQLGNVDEKKIPPQILPQYTALKAKNAPQGKTPQEIQTQMREKIREMAKMRAMAATNVTKEELDIGEFSDDPDVSKRVQDFHTAYALEQNKIISDTMEKYNQQQRQAQAYQNVQKGVVDFINQQSKVEPHFDDIDKMMMNAYADMPHKAGAVVEPAVRAAIQHKMTEKDAEILGEYYKYCRKEYYAKLNKTSTTPQQIPPKVETKGTGAEVKEKIDYAKALREANARDKSAVLNAWLKAKKKA
jgi:hypothetical protein